MVLVKDQVDQCTCGNYLDVNGAPKKVSCSFMGQGNWKRGAGGRLRMKKKYWILSQSEEGRMSSSLVPHNGSWVGECISVDTPEKVFTWRPLKMWPWNWSTWAGTQIHIRVQQPGQSESLTTIPFWDCNSLLRLQCTGSTPCLCGKDTFPPWDLPAKPFHKCLWLDLKDYTEIFGHGFEALITHFFHVWYW